MTARRPDAPDRRRLTGQVLWNLRGLALFLIGPAAGVGLGDAIFGLPTGLAWAAAFMFLVSLSLFGLLARGEWRRLAAPPVSPPGRPVR